MHNLYGVRIKFPTLVQSSPEKFSSQTLLHFQAWDVDGLDRTAGAIRGRSTRICGVVSAEMDNYEPGYYTGN